MELLQGGVDRSVIALWLGHESIETTQIYLDADLALKEKPLAKTTPMAKGKASGRYQPRKGNGREQPRHTRTGHRMNRLAHVRVEKSSLAVNHLRREPSET
jgi:hypothetical protein